MDAYLESVAHGIKVSRTDLLDNLKRPEKRGLPGDGVTGVLGLNAEGKPIAVADEVPAECGVMVGCYMQEVANSTSHETTPRPQ